MCRGGTRRTRDAPQSPRAQSNPEGRLCTLRRLSHPSIGQDRRGRSRRFLFCTCPDRNPRNPLLTNLASRSRSTRFLVRVENYLVRHSARSSSMSSWYDASVAGSTRLRPAGQSLQKDELETSAKIFPLTDFARPWRHRFDSDACRARSRRTPCRSR